MAAHTGGHRASLRQLLGFADGPNRGVAALISYSTITDHGAQREHDLAGRRNVGEAGTFSLRR